MENQSSGGCRRFYARTRLLYPNHPDFMDVDLYLNKEPIYKDEHRQFREKERSPAAKFHLAYQRLSWALLENLKSKSQTKAPNVFVAYAVPSSLDLSTTKKFGEAGTTCKLEMLMGVLYQQEGHVSGAMGVENPGDPKAVSQHIGIHRIPFAEKQEVLNFDFCTRMRLYFRIKYWSLNC